MYATTIRAAVATAATVALALTLAQPAAAEAATANASEPSEIMYVTPTWQVPVSAKLTPVRPEPQFCPPSHPWLIGQKKEFAPSRQMPLGTEAVTTAYFLQLRVNSIVQGAGDGKAGGVGDIRLFNDGVSDIAVHFRLFCTNDVNRAYPR
ncbi:hypothetical protein [Agromyces aerolatus]|uniref:hypothetical protein n=1 Tax=Agromyces sp. LY-1074 TaxID=3074080 RepID=UPI00285A4696|nr:MULTISPECIES: hypothetical protein [unclassified Agromyces]MDR5698721.1 hypothetical protein [Agromyces sp. LY-1074]MDR5705015.1 hypothetical protein [Agromyces sp. LY-1358]